MSINYEALDCATFSIRIYKHTHTRKHARARTHSHTHIHTYIILGPDFFFFLQKGRYFLLREDLWLIIFTKLYYYAQIKVNAIGGPCNIQEASEVRIKMLVGEPEGNKHFARPMSVWWMKRSYLNRLWIYGLDSSGSGNGNGHSGYTKGRDFLTI
jgi:hypothetical protein